MKKSRKINKINLRKNAVITAILYCIILFSYSFLYAEEVKKIALNNTQDSNASALQGKTILTGSGLSNEAMTNLKNQEEARLLYILKREEMQKERLTNSRLKCL